MYESGRNVVGIQGILFRRSQREPVCPGCRRPAAIEDAARRIVASLLQIPIHEPHVGVAAAGRSPSGRLRAGGAHVRRPLVRADDVVPHAGGEVDVRRHVQRVWSGRRDRGVPARGAKAQRRVGRIVV